MIEMTYFKRIETEDSPVKYRAEFEFGENDLCRIFGMSMESVSVPTKYGPIPMRDTEGGEE